MTVSSRREIAVGEGAKKFAFAMSFVFLEIREGAHFASSQRDECLRNPGRTFGVCTSATSNSAKTPDTPVSSVLFLQRCPLFTSGFVKMS